MNRRGGLLIGLALLAPACGSGAGESGGPSGSASSGGASTDMGAGSDATVGNSAASSSGGSSSSSGALDAAQDATLDSTSSGGTSSGPGSSASSSGAGEAGGADAGTCLPGEVACSGNGEQTCDSTGHWNAPVACVCGCGAGCNTCVCVPGATQCSGDGVQTCSATGSWGSTVQCASGVCDAGACAGQVAPSCAPGSSGQINCGASSESCCASIGIPGGSFYRTYDYDGYNPDGGSILAADGGATALADPATLSGFRLD
jgi:hypothetical protein